MSVSAVFISHSLIHQTSLTDTAVAVWIVLRRNPATDRGRWARCRPGRLAAALGFGDTPAGRRRIERALKCLSDAGIIDKVTRRQVAGAVTMVRLGQIPASRARGVESVPREVTDMLAAGAIGPKLLRSWLRWLTVIAGRTHTLRTCAEVAAQWGQSLRTVAAHRRRLVALDMLWAERLPGQSRTGVSWLRWWGRTPKQIPVKAAVDSPAGKQKMSHRAVQKMSHGSPAVAQTGRGAAVPAAASLHVPSKQLLPAGASATALQSVPRETPRPDKPAEKNSSSTGPGGRHATVAEKRLGRWMDTSTHLAALRGPGRWAVRSVLAKAHRQMPTDQARAALLDRLAELLTDEPVGVGAAACRGIIHAARVQVIAEIKAGTTNPPTSSPRGQVEMDEGVVALLSRSHASAPAAEPWRYTGPALEAPDLNDPATDPGQIHAWIWSLMSSHADRSGAPARAAAVVADTIRRRTRTSRFADDIAVSLTLLTQLFNQHTESERTAS